MTTRTTKNVQTNLNERHPSFGMNADANSTLVMRSTRSKHQRAIYDAKIKMNEIYLPKVSFQNVAYIARTTIHMSIVAAKKIQTHGIKI